MRIIQGILFAGTFRRLHANTPASRTIESELVAWLDTVMTMTMAAIGTKSAGAVVAIFLPRAAIAEFTCTEVALLREATSRIVGRFDAKRVRKVSAGWTGDPSASVTLHTCSAVVACKAVTIVALGGYN